MEHSTVEMKHIHYLAPTINLLTAVKPALTQKLLSEQPLNSFCEILSCKKKNNNKAVFWTSYVHCKEIWAEYW